MADSFAVHDITQKDRADITPQGQIVQKRIVTFYVGDHGPFTLEYDKAAATGEKIQHDIQSEVVQLRNTVATFTGNQV